MRSRYRHIKGGTIMANDIFKVEKPITVEEAILAGKVFKDPHENNLVKIINDLIIQNMFEDTSGFYFQDAVYRMVEMGIQNPSNPVSRVLDNGSFYIPKCFKEIWDVDDSQILTGGYISFKPKKSS